MWYIWYSFRKIQCNVPALCRWTHKISITKDLMCIYFKNNLFSGIIIEYCLNMSLVEVVFKTLMNKLSYWSMKLAEYTSYFQLPSLPTLNGWSFYFCRPSLHHVLYKWTSCASFPPLKTLDKHCCLCIDKWKIYK